MVVFVVVYLGMPRSHMHLDIVYLYRYTCVIVHDLDEIPKVTSNNYFYRCIQQKPTTYPYIRGKS